MTTCDSHGPGAPAQAGDSPAACPGAAPPRGVSRQTYVPATVLLLKETGFYQNRPTFSFPTDLPPSKPAPVPPPQGLSIEVSSDISKTPHRPLVAPPPGPEHPRPVVPATVSQTSRCGKRPRTAALRGARLGALGRHRRSRADSGNKASISSPDSGPSSRPGKWVNCPGRPRNEPCHRHCAHHGHTRWEGLPGGAAAGRER